MADPIITSTNTGNRGNNLTMTGNQAAARNNPGQAGRSVGQMSSYGVARSGMNQIRQGDVIRGEISDLRNNEITITLENNTLIKGQIADSSSLSIGQTAAFRLSSVSPWRYAGCDSKQLHRDRADADQQGSGGGISSGHRAQPVCRQGTDGQSDADQQTIDPAADATGI